MWQLALNEMGNNRKNIYGPKSFIQYCKENNIRNSSTANHISIDYYEKLHKQLRIEETMVLRLGSSDKKAGTNFAIVKNQSAKEFFFFDDEIFIKERSLFHADVNVKNLLSLMKLFEKHSEMMLVSYLLSSGALSEVLRLDKTDVYYTPLTGRNGFSFKFYPTKNHDLIFHDNGQVEIDAVFSGHKNGKPVVVVAEAKVEDGKYKSLAKHKLFYAYKSVQSVLNDEFEIIPIYLKLSIVETTLIAKIAVCEDVNNCLSEFRVIHTETLMIKM